MAEPNTADHDPTTELFARSLIEAISWEPFSQFDPANVRAVAGRMAAALTVLDDQVKALQNDAADMLDHYADYIRTVKADDLERHPYLPEIERIASELRLSKPTTSPRNGA